MIAIILRQPNGDGTWSDRIGLTTGDSAVTVAGFQCLPGWIGDGDVSEWSHRLNISQARGGVPEAITWGFGLIDWDGSVRRSVGILDGQAQMVGWAVAMYVSTDGVTWSDAILGSVHFRVKAAPVNGRRIAVECVEAWGMDSHAVGESAGGLQVGAVAGGMPVTVEVPEIADPVALEYLGRIGGSSDSIAWRAGVPGDYSTAGVQQEYGGAWESSGNVLYFFCVDEAEAERFRAELQSLLDSGFLVVSGSKLSEVPASISRASYTVKVSVSSEFRTTESDASKVRLFNTEGPSFPVAYGASSVVGWAVGNIAAPAAGSETVTDFVLSFAPSRRAADGSFSSRSPIQCDLVYAPATTDNPREPDGVNTARWYAGDVANVVTDGSTPPAFSTYSATDLSPTSSTSGALVWAWGANALNENWSLRVVSSDDLSAFETFSVDLSARLVLRNANSGYMPFRSGGLSGVPLDTSTGDNVYTLSMVGPENIPTQQQFASKAALMSPQDLSISVSNGNGRLLNFEITGIRLYGTARIDPSSSHAVVQPGASRWWSSPEIPSKAADLLLSDLEDSGWVASSPSYEPSASRWGLAFDADRRVIDAAADIASEFWTVLGEGSNDVQAGAEGEIPGPPSFTLGDPVDIVTEPVIEYDYWAGAYRKRAYIAHVDEPYNSEDSQRYFAGWDEDGASTSYGLQIWMACRAAWLHHGRRKSVVYQSPGVRDAGILGWMWCATRNGRSRAEWLSLQTRYMTFSVRETVPSWWSGNVVRIPQTMATWAGYDLSALTSESLVVTEKRWNPLDMVTTFEVALPPVVPAASGDVIMQQLGAGYDLIQQTLNAGDDLLSQVVQ